MEVMTRYSFDPGKGWTTYHQGEGERYDVNWHQGAETGQDGEEQVVPGFGSVPSDLCDGTGLARQRGPRGAHRQRAGPAAQAGPAIKMAAWFNVKLGRHRGHYGGCFTPHRSDAVTWK